MQWCNPVFFPPPEKPDEPESAAPTPQPVSAPRPEPAKPKPVDIKVWAAERLHVGDKPSEVRKQLKKAGYTEAQAEDILQWAIEHQRSLAEAPTADAVFGAKVFVLGCIVFCVGLMLRCGTYTPGAGAPWIVLSIMTMGFIAMMQGVRSGGARLFFRNLNASSQRAAEQGYENATEATMSVTAIAKKALTVRPRAVKIALLLLSLGTLTLAFCFFLELGGDTHLFWWKVLTWGCVLAGVIAFIVGCRQVRDDDKQI